MSTDWLLAISYWLLVTVFIRLCACVGANLVFVKDMNGRS
jgi:hypothetical protein